MAITGATQVQLRRGTSTQVANFIGASGEVVVDVTYNRIVINDGTTLGGWTGALLTDFTGFATISNLTLTGVTLDNNLQTTGSILYNDIITTNNSLFNTGNTLQLEINSLSGYSSSNISTTNNNLYSTGNNLQGQISSTNNNLQLTGASLQNQINNLSGLDTGLFYNSVYQTGSQIISGLKDFTSGIAVSYISGDSNYLGIIDNSGILSVDWNNRDLYSYIKTGLQPLIPNMTSNTTPFGIVSDNYSDSNAWNALSSGNSYGNTVPVWIQYQFSNPKIVNAYSLIQGGVPSFPRNFSLSGSNNGTNWTNLDTQNSYYPSTGNPQLIYISNNSPFVYYRFLCLSGNGAASSGSLDSFVSITNFQVYSGINYGYELSVDWKNRILFNTFNQQSLDWGNHILTGNWNAQNLTISGTNIVLSNQTGQFYPVSNPSGYISGFNSGQYYLNTNPSGFITGFNSGIYLTTGQTGQFASVNNLVSTGNVLYNDIIGLSGSINNNLYLTGHNLQNQINNLSGLDTGLFYNAIYTTGQQTIYGLKDFSSGIAISYISGDNNYLGIIDNTGNISIDWNNRLLYGNYSGNLGSFIPLVNWNNGQLIDGNGTIVISWPQHQLLDHLSNNTLNWDLEQLYSKFYGLVLDWGAFTLYDSTNISSYNWASRQFYDNTGKVSLDYAKKILNGNWTGQNLFISGSGSVINSSQTGQFYATSNPSGYINNLSGISTGNLQNLIYTTGNQNISGLKTFKSGLVVSYISGGSNYVGLVDNNNNLSLDWVNYRTLDNSLNVSVDWQNRFLFDSSSADSIDWDNRTLFDGNEINSIQWDNFTRFLIDNNGDYALDWNNRYLLDIAGNTSVDWQKRILSGNWNAQNLVSTEVYLKTSKINFKNTGNFSIMTVPSGYLFLIDTMEVITSDITSPSGAPYICFGNTVNISGYVNPIQTLSNSQYYRHIFNNPQNAISASTILTATIKSGSTATMQSGFLSYKGMLIPNL